MAQVADITYMFRQQASPVFDYSSSFKLHLPALDTQVEFEYARVIDVNL